MDQSERESTDRFQEGEKSRTLYKDRHSRLCVVSNEQGTPVIELVIDMFPQCPRVDLEMIQLKFMIIQDLRERGYELACDHDSFICAEREFGDEGLEAEIRNLMEIISRLNG
jgi:hypothetical protein